MGVTFAPHKTDSPLIVDSDAVLAGSIAFQRLEAITWYGCQVAQ
ncbi:MAG TPA: hypothetical protein VEJ86_10745 [Candidatus Binataceae bacterium]|nr:hypothetical protein [Candidatus Binataceae bacterium]